MSEFQIDDIFQVSFRMNPIIVSRTDDLFAVGDNVETMNFDALYRASRSRTITFQQLRAGRTRPLPGAC
ncbi:MULTISPECIES: hypothetical protein [Nocardia]|uniref:hypothetical protein n=1 Tax=Nocardia TaxID=1817 RepID=UPI000AEBE1A9|nr:MULTISPECIES: hypothetical protein [Nocardia]MBF6278696.1 hypothetical protein [Nocardia nova]